MMFKRITISAEPKIIGVTNGIYQVEINEDSLKENPNYDEISGLLTQVNLDDFLANRHRLFNLQVQNITGKLLKKAKQTDLMGYSPYYFGFHFLVSQKFVDILDKNEIDNTEYHLIKVNIDKIKTNYFLFYVPWISNTEINFSESLIYPSIEALSPNKNYFEVRDYDAYCELNKTNPITNFERVVLDNKYSNRDIISVQGVSNLFFSDRLIEAVTSENVSNFEIRDYPILKFSDNGKLIETATPP